MGIKYLLKFIEKHSPESMRFTKYQDYFNKTVAIDMSLLVYKLVYRIRIDKDLKNSKGKSTSHIYGIYYKLLGMIYSGIIPVPVFDGTPTNLKKELVDKRNSVKSNIYVKLQNDNLTKSETKSLQVRSYILTTEDIMDLKRLSELLGLCCIQSPEEADVQCAILTLAGKVNAVMSDDTDIPVFGGLMTLQKFNKNNGKEINLRYLLRELKMKFGFDFIDFVNICIVLGSDYCPGIENIGPIKVAELYKKGISSKEVGENMVKFLKYLEKETKYNVSDEFKKRWKKAQNYFTNTAKVYDPRNITIEDIKPDIIGLKKFLIEENDFNKDKVEKQLDKLMLCLEKYKKGYT